MKDFHKRASARCVWSCWRQAAVDVPLFVVWFACFFLIWHPPLCIVGGTRIIGLSAWACDLAPPRITKRVWVAVDVPVAVHPSQVPIGCMRSQEHPQHRVVVPGMEVIQFAHGVLPLAVLVLV